MQWEQFLTAHNIEYVTSGPNTKRGEISIKCPWCGSDDPSQHLGINPTKGVWGCHRNQQHRGKSAVHLISALLGCTPLFAKLTYNQWSKADPDEFDKMMAVPKGEPPKVAEEGTVEFPPEFRSFTANDRFGIYLKHRLHKNHDHTIAKIVNDFGLKCADTGRFKDRVIFPLYLDTGLIGWTARAITDPIHAPRYLASSAGAKATVYNFDKAKSGGEALFIVEGPLDALAISTIHCDACAVALMGTSVTIPQIILLKRLIPLFTTVMLWLDNDAVEQTFHLSDLLKVKTMPIIHPYKDPASIPPNTLYKYVELFTVPF